MAATLAKQLILISGATNGIGLDSAKFLLNASENYHVIFGARNLTKGESVLKEVQAQKPKGTASLVQLDLNDDASITAAAKNIEKEFGRLDVLINNAGICPETMGVLDTTRELLRANFETNVFGTTLLSQALIPLLKLSKEPKIINISTGLASITELGKHDDYNAGVTVPAYRMSKAALNMLTAYQWKHLKPLGFKVWSFCPGYVITDLGRDREQRKQSGLETSETSAQGVLEIVEGKRDAEVGTFIARRGQHYDW